MIPFYKVAVGQSFNFVNDYHLRLTSFYLRCTKISSRKYKDERGTIHQVGTIYTLVHHVVKIEQRG